MFGESAERVELTLWPFCDPFLPLLSSFLSPLFICPSFLLIHAHFCFCQGLAWFISGDEELPGWAGVRDRAQAASSLPTSLSSRLADVNECELMLAVCGAALCENVEGSFLCLCPSDLEEYDAQEGHCRPRVAGGETCELSTGPLPPVTYHDDSLPYKRHPLL